jgi:two-component sensor histidine kinase
MASIHEMLHRSTEMAAIEFADYLPDLAASLLRSSGADGNVELRTAIEPISLDMDTAIPCALVVNELLSNSLKHAFPEGRRGRLDLVMTRDPEGMVTLEVRDDGVGLPPDVEERGTHSLGLQLVRSLTRQLGGALDTTCHGPGTCSRLRFPLPPAAKGGAA